MSDPVTLSTLSLGAHLLTEAGSAIARARDLLELADWPGADGHYLEIALEEANRQVNGARMLVDGHTAAMFARARGEAPADPAALEVARERILEGVAS